MPTELLRRCAFQPVMLNFTLLLVVGGEEADLNEACRVVYTAAARSIRTALGVSCRAGVSRPFHKLHHMQLAAQEAWEALRLPEADAPEASGQMLYYQPPDEQCARNGYDTLLEHEITAAVTACKAKEVRHLLERFTAKMLEKNIRGYERQFYIQRLVAAMLAVAENAGLSVNQVLADRQANLFETISKIYTADQMQNFLMDEVAVPVMDLLTEFRQSSSSELVKNVLALIKQTRGDITLNECADRLNYNPSYIWKVLRTEKDTSFSDLANNEKLEMAKELLLTSDMTVVQIAETLNAILKPEQHTTVLLETMAGKGTEVGSHFEELREILDRVTLSDLMGVCLDTCHVFDAGYDIVNDLDGVLTEFDRVIGLNRLKAVHINDSIFGLSSHKDRHAKIGEGKIGTEAFRRIINHPVLRRLPFYLETPNELPGYKAEIELLRAMVEEN